MRRVAAVSALLALACAVGVVLTSDGGFDALLANGSDAVTKANHQLAAIERTPALARNAAESMLKKSKNKKHPWMDNEAFRGIYPSKFILNFNFRAFQQALGKCTGRGEVENY